MDNKKNLWITMDIIVYLLQMIIFEIDSTYL